MMTDQSNTHERARRQTQPGNSRPVEPGRKTLHPADALSFTRLRPKQEWKPAGLYPRCWWSVKPTGDYDADCRTGRKMGLEYLAYEASENSGGVLGLIVAAMPRELSGIEVSFLQLVSFAAAAGHARAERIAAYWERCESQAEATHA